MYYERNYHGEMRAEVESDVGQVVPEFRTAKLHGFSVYPWVSLCKLLTALSDVPSGLIPMAKIHAGNEPMSFHHIPKATNP